jgi:hypothetical protein
LRGIFDKGAVMTLNATPAGRCSIACLTIVLLSAAAPARAQTDFTGLKARPGDRVRVTRASGVTIDGPLGAVEPASITVNGETIRYEPGLKIAREGDRLLNGIVLGAAVGVVMGSTVGAEACLDDPIVACAVGGAVVWSGIGALVDWLHKGRTRIFEAPLPSKPSVRVVPALGLERQSIGIVLSF